MGKEVLIYNNLYVKALILNKIIKKKTFVHQLDYKNFMRYNIITAPSWKKDTYKYVKWRAEN